MTTSVNVIFEAQFKDFLISRKIHVPFLKYSFFTSNHSINFKSCHIMVLADKVENIFQYLLKSLGNILHDMKK